MKKEKELPILSVTANDFRWDYYRGSGKGGQARNKTDNCCRCTHAPSGVSAYSEDGRSKEHNRREAFMKVANDPKFRFWLKLETMKRMGKLRDMEAKLEHEMTLTKLEVKEDGKWVEKPRDAELDRHPINNED